MAMLTDQAGWSPAIPATFIQQLTEKLADGRYPTEPVRCFCGADFNDTVLAERDRYFIPHRNVMCNECSLIRATPRMTPEAYEQFYQHEYRPIYDGWQFGADAENDEKRFLIQSGQGLNFKLFLEYFDIKPKSLIDFGCNTGGMLAPFQEEGATIYGIEWHQRSREFGRNRGITIFPSLEEALVNGVTAEMVILQDVVEHLTDLHDLTRIAQLMQQDGYLYIGTPGVFEARLSLLWQNAHTYTFIGETLRYVMGELGFEEVFLDECIASLWVYHGTPAKLKKPKEWARYVVEHLENKAVRSVPPLKGVNKFPVTQRWKHMDANLAHGLPDIKELIKTQSGEALIIAAGPSVDAQVPFIHELISRGVKTFVIERMYPWCQTVGIKPDYVVALDSSEDVKDGFTAMQEGVTYLMSTTVPPAVIEQIHGEKVYLFNPLNPHMKAQNLWFKHGYEKVAVINSGGSVTLGAFVIAMSLGFKQIHFVGFDLKATEQDYASGVAGKGVPRHYSLVEIGGKQVFTCLSFISFAQQFFNIANMGHQSGMLTHVDVHGDSLITDMADLTVLNERGAHNGQ